MSGRQLSTLGAAWRYVRPGEEDERLAEVRLERDSPVRGVVSTEWTATARSVRGRGIARALKCETVAQAIALRVDRVRTGNDAANDRGEIRWPRVLPAARQRNARGGRGDRHRHA